MTDLLTAVLDAHGGLDSWKRVSGLPVELSLGGPFWAGVGWPDILAKTTASLDTT